MTQSVVAAGNMHSMDGHAMHSDPDKQSEHNQLTALISGHSTHIAKQSGSWFDPNTWVGGKVPGDNAKVLIGEDFSVNYDSKSNARLFTVGVHGELTFSTNKDTTMVVDTLVIAPEGKLEIGTKDDPVKAGVKTEILIADNGPLDLNWDPGQFSRGLISHGDVQIHGQAKTSHLKLAKDPMAGDRTLVLQETPINWAVGDRLVLTGTRFAADKTGAAWEAASQDEEVTIKSINGKQITLEQSLAFDHDTPRSDLKAYVANQSRNIVIASENGDQLPTHQRGHTMFMHSDDVDIRYAEFKDLGRTDKTKPLDNFKLTSGDFPKRVLDHNGDPIPGERTNIPGRYAAHIHRVGTDGNPAVLVGNVVDGSPGWGFVVHDSSAILEENVAYDISGGAFVTESGNETGAFRNNISIKTGPGISDYNEKQGVGNHDFARTGIGFWFQGRLVENEGNVAAGSRKAGMFYFHRGADLIGPDINTLPTPGLIKDFESGSESSIPVDNPPIQGFKDNEVFASGAGLHVVKNFPKQGNDLRSVLDGFKGWEVERGTALEYTSHYTLKDFDLIGSESARAWNNQGLFLQKNSQEIVFDNMSIDGFEKGVAVLRPEQGGIQALDDKQLIWIDLELKNNKADTQNIEFSDKSLLTKADLNPGTLSFQVSDESDFEVSITGGSDYVSIKGVKTDSLGKIEAPFGNDKLAYDYEAVRHLASQGYYTLPDGTHATVVEEYFSDRVTGEVKKYPFIVTFKESWWTNDAPYLGELNPNSIGGPTRVELPESKFELDRSPMVVSEPIITPVTPAPVVTPDPVDPITPDPVDPLPLPPIDTMQPSLSELSPVASYNFNASSGKVINDVSTEGKDNSAKLSNSGVNWDIGVGGNALHLDGTGKVSVPNSNDINLGMHAQRSISMWFKSDQLPTNNRNQRQVIYEEGGATRGLNAYLDKDGLHLGGWNYPTSESGWRGTWISTDQIFAGEWHHIALVLEGTESVKSNAITAYLDGEKIGTGRGSQLWSHGDGIGLGSITGSTRFRDGSFSDRNGLIGAIDEAHIFNDALTGDQVQSLASQFG
ncbi:MAG: G8 domain-containing protein [Cyanobacteria bacterium J06634_6]